MLAIWTLSEECKDFVQSIKKLYTKLLWRSGLQSATSLPSVTLEILGGTLLLPVLGNPQLQFAQPAHRPRLSCPGAIAENDAGSCSVLILH
jgi:hypothetical protein